MGTEEEGTLADPEAFRKKIVDPKIVGRRRLIVIRSSSALAIVGIMYWLHWLEERGTYGAVPHRWPNVKLARRTILVIVRSTKRSGILAARKDPMEEEHR